MFETLVRHVIFIFVGAVLLLRTPVMVRDQRQRPLWLVLVAFGGGSMAIQPWFGAAVNRVAGIPQLNNLIQGLWGVLNIAITLEFAITLANSSPSAARWRSGRFALVLATAVGMTLCFALTPESERFTPPSQLSPFAVYAVLAAIYMVGAAGATAWTIGRNLALVKGRTLQAALGMVAVGNATEVPFMVIRTLQRLTLHVVRAVPELLQIAFLLNTARFILIPLGCVIAAAEPSCREILYYCRRVRLYPLWYLLRSATIELALVPLVSRMQDALTTDNSWERLHRRVVEVHDSILYLYDGWARPELLDQSTRRAQVRWSKWQSCGPTACWLEVARREALLGAPKRYCVVPDRELLPRVFAQESAMRVEVRYLLQLHQTLKSRPVRNFADSAIARSRQ